MINPIASSIQVDCHNLGYIRGSIKWKCQAVLEKDISFDNLDVQCERAYDGPFSDSVIVDSCGLAYSLRRISYSGQIIGWIVGVAVILLFFTCVVYMCVKCCEGEVGGTVYTTHSPTVISPRPTVYSTPVIAPAVVAPAYYPSPAYTTTNIGFSGTSYRNDAYDNTHVSSGLASTTFRNDYSSGYTGGNYSTGYTGGNDSNIDVGFAGTSFR